MTCLHETVMSVDQFHSHDFLIFLIGEEMFERIILNGKAKKGPKQNQTSEGKKHRGLIRVILSPGG